MVLTPADDTMFYLYYSMRLFFDNGGGTCYVVSVGEAKPGATVDPLKLQEGLTAIADVVGPTMLVVPDAVLIPKDGELDNNSGIPYSDTFSTVVKAMLTQSSELQDRVAILDVYGTGSLNQKNSGFETELNALIERFHADVGDHGLNFGMAYFPFLQTSVVTPSEIDYTSVENQDKLMEVLNAQASNIYGGPNGNNQKYTTVTGYIQDMSTSKDVDTLNQNLRNALPVMNQLENAIARDIGVLPSSGAMAGLYALNDQTRGVWNAPANDSLTSVVAPTVNQNNSQQGDINVPLDGKAINAIRSFPGRGPVVWEHVRSMATAMTGVTFK